MTIKPPQDAFHFPTSSERAPFPFPTSKSMSERKAAADVQPQAQPSAEELRLMADTMPGDGPGD
jgi:Tfp pilus assembly protein PilP